MELCTNLEKNLLKCYQIFDDILWMFEANLAQILRKLNGNFEKIFQRF